MPRRAARKKKEEEEEEEEEVEEEEEEEPPKKKQQKKKKEKPAAAAAAAPPGKGTKERPEDCDAFWAADSDRASIDGGDDSPADYGVPAVPDDARHVKIVSWNVAGLRAALGKGLADYVRREQPDVLCLQETKIAADDAAVAAALPGYTLRCVHACADAPGRHGTALFTRDACRVQPLRVTRALLGDASLDREGRLVAAEFATFHVLCCYTPNSSRGAAHWPLRDAWDAAFRAYVRRLDAEKPVVWCGDLNVARLWIDLANPKTNCNRTAGFLYGERDNMQRLLDEADFVDVYRERFPRRKGFYTFWTYMGGARAKDVGWRLDYFITSRRILPAVKAIFRRATVQGSECVFFSLSLSLSPFA